MRARICSPVACRKRRAAAGPAQLRVDHPVWLAGSVVPGRDEPVQFLAQGGERLAGRTGCGIRGGDSRAG